MAKPTPKSDAINKLLSDIAGKDRVKTIEADMCMTCPGEAKEFRHPDNFREYCISGMCQICQDRVYGNPYEGDV